MEEEKLSVELSEHICGYYIGMMDADRLYEVLKKEIKFKIMIEVLKRFNKDLRECLQDEKSILCSLEREELE